MSDPAPPPKLPGRAVFAALAGVQLAFASLSIVGKVTLGVVSPLALVQCRLAGGALVFGAGALLAGRPLVPPREARTTVLTLALLGLVLNQLLFTYGLQRTSAVEGTVLIASIPLLTVLYAVLSGREKARPALWAGLALALSGAVLVAFSRNRGAVGSPHLVGDALVLANCAAYAAYLVRARDTIQRYGSDRVLVWIFLVAAVLVSPLGVPALVTEAPHWSPRVGAAVAYLVLGPTVFAYGANAWALARAPSSLVAVFVYVQPALAILLSLTLGAALARWLGVAPSDERVTVTMLAGLAAIFAGVALTTRPRKR